MARETFRVHGLAGVVKTLQELPPELVSQRGGPVRSALRKAAVPIHRQVKQNLQGIIDTPNIGSDRSTGLLSKNIVITRGKMPGGQKGERYLVRVRNKKYPDKFGKGSTTAANARRLEYGTERRQPMPFIRPAFESKKQEAVDVFGAELTKATDRVLRKLKKRNQVKD